MSFCMQFEKIGRGLLRETFSEFFKRLRNTGFCSPKPTIKLQLDSFYFLMIGFVINELKIKLLNVSNLKMSPKITFITNKIFEVLDWLRKDSFLFSVIDTIHKTIIYPSIHPNYLLCYFSFMIIFFLMLVVYLFSIGEVWIALDLWLFSVLKWIVTCHSHVLASNSHTPYTHTHTHTHTHRASLQVSLYINLKLPKPPQRRKGKLSAISQRKKFFSNHNFVHQP